MTVTPLFADLVDPIGQLTALHTHLEQETEDLLFFCLDHSGYNVASAGFPLEAEPSNWLHRRK